MPHQDHHLSDQDLVLAADGELTPRRDAEVRAHLSACWQCRSRLRGMEGAIADFVQLHSATLDPQLPPAAGPRALLKARLTEDARQSAAPRRLVLAQVAFALTLAGVAIALVLYLVPRPATASVPRPQLTPGAVRPVMKSDVCAVSGNQVLVVPVALQRRVFEEYGIRNARTDAYEVDYLITPELGGASDIRNLWPEPYSSTEWNARVKDALEQRLHQMVCDGQLDLATAQHDIATNWIAAYKKYFNSNRPRQN
ncbi:MAG: zf-HC2 domain-containing protein [Bryobacteraceae bacterium]